jgi:hypothetical protein
MAGQIQTILKMLAGTGALNWATDDIRITAANSPTMPSQDGSVYLSSITNELAGHRLQLTGRSVVEDTVNKRANFMSDCPKWLNANAGRIMTLWIYKYNVNDAAALVLIVLDPADLVENGTDVLCEFNGQIVNGLVIAL